MGRKQRPVPIVTKSLSESEASAPKLLSKSPETISQIYKAPASALGHNLEGRSMSLYEYNSDDSSEASSVAESPIVDNEEPQILRRSSSASQLGLRSHGFVSARGRFPVSGIHQKASVSFQVSNTKKNSASRSPKRGKFRLSLFFSLLRYPLLLLILCFVLLDLLVLTVTRLLVSVTELLFVWRGPLKQLHSKLSKSETYAEWKENASSLDRLMKNDEWKAEEDSRNLYNSDMIRKSTRRLRKARKVLFDPKEVMKHLTYACKKNHGGSLNEALYSNCYIGTKRDVEQFFKEVEAGISFVSASATISSEDKSSFFKFISRNFGRSALCLSGGGSITYYHLGVLKALFEQKLLPDIISGTSGGSLLAAMICTRTDEELIRDGIFDPNIVAKELNIMRDSWSQRVSRLFREGYMFDVQWGFDRTGELTNGHMTFLEAYQKTGRILCISVTPDESNMMTPHKVLNFMTAPDVVISSAVCASCSLPFVLPSAPLVVKTENGDFVPYKGSGKKWRDGSIRSDVPDLSSLNVTFNIVSQVNPHIVVFFYESQGSPGSPTPHRGGRGWRGGFLASTLIHMLDLDLKKWLRLCKDLRLLPPLFATDVSSVFLQQFEGTVTILPSNTDNIAGDCMYAFADPTVERLSHCIKLGELKTWPKLTMIKSKVRLEKLIKAARLSAVASVTARNGRKRTGSMNEGHLTDFFDDL